MESDLSQPHVSGTPVGIHNAEPPEPQPASARILARVLDLVDYGILLVRADAKVTFVNQGARLELDDAHPLQLSGQRLTTRHRGDGDALANALDGALRKGLQRLLTIGGDACRLVSIAVLPIDGAGDGTPPDALLVLGKRAVCGDLSAEAFARHHHLTAAELRVLKELCAGYQAAEIAKRQGVALCTVRTQISRIRDKIGASSIGAVVRHVARLPPLMQRRLVAG